MICPECGHPIAAKMGPTTYRNMLRLRRESRLAGVSLGFSSDLDRDGYIDATVNGRPVHSCTTAGHVRSIVEAGYGQR